MQLLVYFGDLSPLTNGTVEKNENVKLDMNMHTLKKKMPESVPTLENSSCSRHVEKHFLDYLDDSSKGGNVKKEKVTLRFTF